MKIKRKWILIIILMIFEIRECFKTIAYDAGKPTPEYSYNAAIANEEPQGIRIETENKSNVKKISIDRYLMKDFEVILQMPELPTGCEITAMTMVLNYYGVNVDKVTMAREYLPVLPAEFYYNDAGQMTGPDPEWYFIGDPETEGGYFCGTGAIVTAANEYLQEQEILLNAVDMTGKTPKELYELVSEGIPVMVWVTISMTDRDVSGGWYSEDGDYVDWSVYDHGAVLIGYTEDTVTIADPISGIAEYEKQAFEDVFISRGNKCVILQD